MQWRMTLQRSLQARYNALPAEMHAHSLHAENDPYILHFSATSAHLTTTAREAAVSGQWSLKRRKIDHVGRAIELHPQSGVEVQPVNYTEAVRYETLSTYRLKAECCSGPAQAARDL